MLSWVLLFLTMLQTYGKQARTVKLCDISYLLVQQLAEW